MKEFTHRKSPTNVNSVRRHLDWLDTRRIMNEYILGKNPTNASFVGEHSFIGAAKFYMKEPTQK